MLGFRYLKTEPTKHVLLYKNGRVVKQGPGLSFWYFSPTSTVVTIPLASTNVPFVFEETTKDFQDATIQGELVYRIADPLHVAELLDFSVGSNGRYLSDDPTNLNDRLVQTTKTISRGFVQQHDLDSVLVGTEPLVQTIVNQLRESETVRMLGVEVIGLTLHSIKPTPEMAKALQANAREQLLQKADEAVHARRNTAIELERQIKENELKTEVAVEQKRREVRKTKLEADIALEQQRAEFVDMKVENERKESQARNEALRDAIEAVKDVDWRTLMATGVGDLDSKQLIAMAFRDLADSADKVGNLNISPDLLSTLLGEDRMERPSGEKAPSPSNPKRRK